MHEWSPRGASRFLELVRAGYYDGVGFTRVVPGFLVQAGLARERSLASLGTFPLSTRVVAPPGFLAQFGIGADAASAARWRAAPIADDAPGRSPPFEPGFVSYAGSGPDSRTAEIFVALSPAHAATLRNFGTNPWETPFARLRADDDLDVFEVRERSLSARRTFPR